MRVAPTSEPKSIVLTLASARPSERFRKATSNANTPPARKVSTAADKTPDGPRKTPTIPISFTSPAAIAPMA